MIRRWKTEYINLDRRSFTGNGVVALSPEESRTRQVKLELKDVQMERDILKKVRLHPL
tara:strand:- start:456 stop:629 length:174 start_codon:yes stop_codon:yes gene_type:complete